VTSGTDRESAVLECDVAWCVRTLVQFLALWVRNTGARVVATGARRHRFQRSW